jgi:DNA-binding XRE family transcriptional regulator
MNFWIEENKANINPSNKEEGNNTKKEFSLFDRVTLCLDTPIKDRFSVLLNRVGRNQQWLADECEVSKATISKIVNGDWFPSTKLMTRISELLEVQSHVLFGDSKLWKEYHDGIVYNRRGKDE